QLQSLKKTNKSHPFTEFCPKEKKMASAAFVYRTIQVDDKTNNPSELLQVYALNQYDSGLSRTTNWNTVEFSRKAEAVLSEELNNNSYKCARWCTHADLTGIDKIKLGYVRRRKNGDNTFHDIVKVETRQLKELTRPLSLNPKSQWGMFNTFMRNFEELPDGRYIVIREPVKVIFFSFCIVKLDTVLYNVLSSFGL
ncbi:hypothetical protein RFI_06871, partial [Reticulomyxa filosa]